MLKSENGVEVCVPFICLLDRQVTSLAQLKGEVEKV
jgi:hypothetical protein